MDDRYFEQEEPFGFEPPDDPPAPTLFGNEDEAQLYDDALLPAALCAASYAVNCWAFDVAAGAADPAAWIDEARFKADRDVLARALFIAGSCRPLGAQELGLDPALHGATLSRGVWRKGDLSQALVCVAARDGEDSRELHLCIRGTDMDNNPNKAIACFQALIGYFAWTYPRIEKHAKNFEALLDAARRYAEDPANNIGRIVLSGHSLGGAAAESLSKRLREAGGSCSLFTFGSPGTGSGLPLSSVKFAARSARTLASVPFGASSDALDAISSPGGALAAFSALVRGVASRIAPKPKIEAATSDDHHFRHRNDPVPKLGPWMLYSVSCAPRLAMDPTDFERALEGRELGVQGIGAHSCARYMSSVASMISRALDEVSPFCEPSPRLAAWSRAQIDAIELEDRIAPELVAESIALARKTTIDSLSERDPLDPSLPLLLALPEPCSLASSIKSARAGRRLIAMLSRPHLGRDSTWIRPPKLRP